MVIFVSKQAFIVLTYRKISKSSLLYIIFQRLELKKKKTIHISLAAKILLSNLSPKLSANHHFFISLLILQDQISLNEYAFLSDYLSLFQQSNQYLPHLSYLPIYSLLIFPRKQFSTSSNQQTNHISKKNTSCI